MSDAFMILAFVGLVIVAPEFFKVDESSGC
jgi:hypothetical protein